MPLDLRTKDEMKVYAFSKWRMRHIAFNFLDAVYDSLNSNLSREEKKEVLRKVVDWWSSPEYLKEIGNDSSPQTILRKCKEYTKEIAKELKRKQKNE